ncbi:hypothetical protein CEXT_598181 [Caerostris extrusa]|uniref:Uncharacterized protein n=1 Tax=Caerostris extrusa TaxID=172846 RepID=A0AAV4SMY1_CAEEX|nr:hypothetical protein CEXT_598181 [Caerostris extrusa]
MHRPRLPKQKCKKARSKRVVVWKRVEKEHEPKKKKKKNLFGGRKRGKESDAKVSMHTSKRCDVCNFCESRFQLDVIDGIGFSKMEGTMNGGFSVPPGGIEKESSIESC